MEDQAEPGLFLPHDVRCEQRGLLRPGTSVEEESIRRGSNCLHRCFSFPAGTSFTHSEPDPSRPRASLISRLGKSRCSNSAALKSCRCKLQAFDTLTPKTRRKLSTAQFSPCLSASESVVENVPTPSLSYMWPHLSLRSWRTTSWPSPTTLPP